MCDVDEEAVVTAADAPSIYDIPKVLHREGLDAYVVRRLDLPFRDVDWTVWDDLLRRVHHPKRGGHASRWSASTSTCPTPTSRSARRCAPAASPTRRKVQHALDRLRRVRDPGGCAREHLGDVDAVCVPGGFGIRGIEGKLGALTYARTHGIPTLGLCLGLQCMVIEYARNVAGLEKAGSTEFDPDTVEPVIATMEEQKEFVEGAGDLGGTMRLGLLPGRPRGGHASCGRRTAQAPVEERHRHRYEVNNAYREPARARPAWCSPGTNPGLGLVEFVELPARRAPLLRRHPGAPRAALAARPGRTRCSPAWSARPSSGSAPSASRSTSRACAARTRAPRTDAPRGRCQALADVVRPCTA